MHGFFASFKPILKRLKKYRIEVFLLSVATIITIITFGIYLASRSNPVENSSEIQSEIETPLLHQKIIIDIDGAVGKPGVYEVSTSARLQDALNLAHGLIEEADKIFFSRNFNRARLLSDQEKIYIPFSWEVDSGIFVENARTLDYSSPIVPVNNSSTTNTSQSPIIINLNTASAEELDTLPGVGAVTVGKIINNRPYQTIDELLTKKVVNKNVFENIKNSITVNQ